MQKIKNGFTLIELLVVISIISVLITVMTASYSNARQQARDTRTMEDIHNIQTSFEQYFALNGSYPIKFDDAFEGTPPRSPDGDPYLSILSSTEYCICGVMESKKGNAGDWYMEAPCAFNATKHRYFFCAANQQ